MLISNDLISVKPFNQPSGILYYMDFKYTDILKERRKKLNNLIKKIKRKDMERITNTHIYFWGSELSNWYTHEFIYNNETFHNSEQAYMWEKALFFDDYKKSEQILNEPDPKKNKQLGREVENFNPETWNRVSLDIMIDVNYSKWTSTEELKELLLSTGDKILVEGSPLDKIWGVGLHWEDDRILDEKNWEGENRLGVALMEVRKMIKEIKN